MADFLIKVLNKYDLLLLNKYIKAATCRTVKQSHNHNLNKKRVDQKSTLFFYLTN